MGRRLRLLGLAILSSCFAGCPLSSDSSSPNPEGTWTGTITFPGGQSEPVMAATILDGPSFIYQPQAGLVYFLSPLKGSQEFDGQMTQYEQTSGPVLPHPYETADTVYQDRMLISATYVGNVVCGITCPPKTSQQSFAFYLTRDEPVPDWVESVPYIFPTAHWDGFVLAANISTSLDVTPSGRWSGSDIHGCAWSGTFQQIGAEQAVVPVSGSTFTPKQNLFRVTAQGGFDELDQRCDGTLTGAGFFSDTGTGPYQGVPGTYFNLGMILWAGNVGDVLTAPSALVYEFKVR